MYVIYIITETHNSSTRICLWKFTALTYIIISLLNCTIYNSAFRNTSWYFYNHYTYAGAHCCVRSICLLPIPSMPPITKMVNKLAMSQYWRWFISAVRLLGDVTARHEVPRKQLYCRIMSGRTLRNGRPAEVWPIFTVDTHAFLCSVRYTNKSNVNYPRNDIFYHTQNT